MSDVQALLPSSATDILALDLETNGNDPSHPEFEIVGIGFADARACWYVDWRKAEGTDWGGWIRARLRERPLTAFNVGFDGQALLRCGFGWLDWRMCSYGLFRQLATEGFDGQRWNLEALQRDVLGWGGTNKMQLEQLLAKHKLKRDEMWKLADLEAREFGRYCALDAEAALHGFEELRDATFDLGPPGEVLRRYHKEDFMTEVRLLSEQQLRGMRVDVPRLRLFRGMTWLTIQEDTLAWLSRPDVAPYVAEANEAVVQAHRDREPPKFKQDGTVTVRWENWQARIPELERTTHFNPGSTKQLAWLFFDRLGCAPRKYTDGGTPSVDKEVLPFLGPAGRALSSIRKREKLLTYVDACLNRQRDGILHAPMKTVGTMTGRLSGGDTDE